MNYDQGTAKTLTKTGSNFIKLAARLGGDNKYSYGEGALDGDAAFSDLGGTVAAQLQAYLFQVFDAEKRVVARFLGGLGRSSAGLDGKCISKVGSVLGGEFTWKATLSEAFFGPFHLHFGAGLSTVAKIDGRTLELKFAGCGFEFGKKIGFSLFDNKFSFDAGTLFGGPFALPPLPPSPAKPVINQS